MSFTIDVSEMEQELLRGSKVHNLALLSAKFHFVLLTLRFKTRE